MKLGAHSTVAYLLLSVIGTPIAILTLGARTSPTGDQAPPAGAVTPTPLAQSNPLDSAEQIAPIELIPEPRDQVNMAIESARQFVQHGDLANALSVCFQVLNGDPGQPAALDLAVNLLARLSAAAQEAEDFKTACEQVTEAENLADQARRAFEQRAPGTYPPETLTSISLAREMASTCRGLLMEPLRAHLWGRLSTADLMWKDASPWYWKNDLDALSKALTLLRDVRDLLPFVADKDIQNKYFEVYGYIKSSVPSSDWDTVQARAGMLHEK